MAFPALLEEASERGAVIMAAGLGVGVMCFLICTSIILYYWYVVTVSIPTDKDVLRQRYFTVNNLQYSEQEEAAIAALPFHCSVCETNVGPHTKHCAACNRCISNFDHHCKFLNNCIGDTNYQGFRKLINVFLAWLIIDACFILTMAALGLLLTENSRVHSTTQFILTVQGVSAIGVGIATAKLISLHVWMEKRGITTYDYVNFEKELV